MAPTAVFYSHSRCLLLRPRDDGLRPTDIFEGAAGLDFYGALLRTLEEGGGYRRAKVGAPPPAGPRPTARAAPVTWFR